MTLTDEALRAVVTIAAVRAKALEVGDHELEARLRPVEREARVVFPDVTAYGPTLMDAQRELDHRRHELDRREVEVLNHERQLRQREQHVE